MLKRRQSHTLVALAGRLFAIGDSNDESGRLKSVECYDPLENKWQLKSSMNLTRGGHAVSVHDNKIYVFGGYGEIKIEKFGEYYDPLLDQWIMVNIFTENYLNIIVGFIASRIFEISKLRFFFDLTVCFLIHIFF